jgi:hypothetical protein
MKKIIIISSVLLIASCSIFKKKDVAKVETLSDQVANKYANTITSEDLKKHLSIIASDEYEGRETAMPGQK